MQLQVVHGASASFQMSSSHYSLSALVMVLAESLRALRTSCGNVLPHGNICLLSEARLPHLGCTQAWRTLVPIRTTSDPSTTAWRRRSSNTCPSAIRMGNMDCCHGLATRTLATEVLDNNRA